MTAKWTLKGLIFLLVVFSACKQQPEKQKKKTPEESKQKPKTEKFARITDPSEKTQFKSGEPIPFSISIPDSIQLDSTYIYINNELHRKWKEGEAAGKISTQGLPVGGSNFRFEVYLGNGTKEVLYKRFTLLSDIIPTNKQCRVTKTYPHDPQAYTQGLFYENGFLYEGTGGRGQSSLRKVKLENGELINSLTLPPEYFGEGITSYKDRIIQLTWTSRTGFVYDKEKFKLKNKIRYPTEGWGITTDGEKLIMSDGSEIIYFLDPEYFAEIGRIEVYDHEGPVKNLNELEYIDGKVYANVWQESYIIAFDPKTGKTLERIDCSHLVPEKYVNHNDNVLNGIAYDSKQDRIFMTGKRWPTLYQVEFLNNPN